MIRPYTTKDKQQVIALLRLNTPQYFDVSEEADLRHYLENELESYFVAEENNQVVGAGGINYFLSERLARISWDFVHPDVQGKGIGKALLLHRIKEINSHPEIETIMVRTSQLAYRFYEKVGFKLEKTVKDFWAEGFDLYQMKMSNK
ncbi:GNAT family N-acetyltransferase [Limibacter armeniacum]|uniref:GNAT family N-acetyltransferase n=1 Tax=Limibacter armeniacum TaxID=466084 RepID=UPI002FE5F7BB